MLPLALRANMYTSSHKHLGLRENLVCTVNNLYANIAIFLIFYSASRLIKKN